MIRVGIKLKLKAYVVLVLTFTGIKATTSGGFRGKLVEKIGKSRHKIVRSIEFKNTFQLKVSIFLLKFKPNLNCE